MTTYYVRKTGSDAAAGTSAGAAWLTISKAETVMTAGDTVYVGAGIYREEITLSTYGTSGSPITYSGDTDGSQTGDAGLVTVTAFDSPTAQSAARGNAFDLGTATPAKWITIEGFDIVGGSRGIGTTTTTGNHEGIIIQNCSILANHAIAPYYGAVSSAPSQGLRVLNCMISGSIFFNISASTGTPINDYDILIENCTFLSGATTLDIGINVIINAVPNKFTGFRVNACTFLWCQSAILIEDGFMAGDNSISNCLFIGCGGGITYEGTNDEIASNHNSFYGSQTPYTNIPADADNDLVANQGDPGGIGGIQDFTLRRALGWSPYLPWEPMASQDMEAFSPLMGMADAATSPAEDIYGEVRGMGDGVDHEFYYFNDSSPTDALGVWTNDANAFDGSYLAGGTYATVATGGSTNYLEGIGTNAPTSGREILLVEMDGYAGSDTGLNSCFMHAEAYDGAVSLGGANIVHDPVWGLDGWFTLDEPSGGWTWSKVNGLGCRFSMIFTSGNTDRCYGARLRVTVRKRAGDDRGAVQHRARPQQETTTVQTGDNSIRFEGAGYHDFLLPVNAEVTTVTIAGRFDANYTGSKPKLDVFNIPGVADQTDIMTGSSGTWEDLTASFTPDTKGIVRVRVTSQDTSVDGEAFFDDLVIS